MSVYKLLICPVCKYKNNAPKIERLGSWCKNCKTFHEGSKKRCPDCGKSMLEAGPRCPRHPEQVRYYSAKWYVKAAGRPAYAVSERYSDAVGEEASLKKNLIEGRGHLNKVTRTKWGEARKQFELWAKTNVKPGTLKRMFIPSLNRLENRFAHLTLDQITVEMVEQHKNYYLAKGNSASTINHDITTLKRMIGKSVDFGLVESNRIASVERLVESDPREIPLSDAQIKELLLRCKRKKNCKCASLEGCKCKKRPRPHTYIFTLIALHTGLRKIDIRTLKRSDLNFETGMIRTKLEKTANVISIPMTAFLKAELQEHIKTQGSVSISRWLFPSPLDKTKPLHWNTSVGFSDAAEDAGLHEHARALGYDGFHFHDLRHTFATKFLVAIGMERGRDASLMLLKEILGHKDLKSTQRYAHILDQYLKQAMSDFGDSFSV